MAAGRPLLEVRNLSVKFCRDLKRSLWYGVQDMTWELLGLKRNNGPLRKEEFWAVQNVSFDLHRGQCLGLIGPNGAGKSTLLKVLNGLFKPNSGTITLRGRVCALIELGTGFRSVLTGRENVFINGSILGLSKGEIHAKFDRIVEFSEIGEFIDAPVKSYSTGMALRLAFAIAAQMEPDVLLLDEVLAVGDVGFRSKCYSVMQQMLSRSAVVFVSHAMPQVSRLCTHILVLNHGEVKYQGSNVPEGIECYYGQFGQTESSVAGTGKAVLREISLSSNGSGSARNGVLEIRHLDPLALEAAISVSPEVERIGVSLLFHDRETRGVAQVCSGNSGLAFANRNGSLRLKLVIPQIPFNPGRYALSLTISHEETGEVLLAQHAVRELQVTGSFFGFTPVQLDGRWEVVSNGNGECRESRGVVES